MKLYKLDADSNNSTHFMYKWTKDGFNYDKAVLIKLSLDNKSLNEHLKNKQPTCQTIKDETSNTKANFSRFMGLSVNFVLDEKAKNILQENLKEQIEFIPIISESETLYMLYVMEYADYDYNNLVREEQILYVENKDGETQPMKIPTRVKKFAFREEKIKGKSIFRPILDAVHKAEIFVDEEFIKLVEDNNLTGFKFTEVWNSQQ